METIYIKKQPHPSQPGELVYVVSAVGIKTPEGKLRLIPHPYGTETMRFEAFDLLLEQIHRSGYIAEFEGKQYIPEYVQSKPRRKAVVHGSLEQTFMAALPILREQLKDASPAVAANAAFALGELRDETALPGLFHAMSNEDGTVRKNVAEALAKIGKPALKVIEDALSDKNWVARHSAVNTVLELVHMKSDLVNTLLPITLAGLKDENWLVRSQVALLLGQAAQLRESTKP